MIQTIYLMRNDQETVEGEQRELALVDKRPLIRLRQLPSAINLRYNLRDPSKNIRSH